MSRMWQLIGIGKKRRLTEAERQELQLLFARLAWQDVRAMKAEGLA